MSLGEQAKNLFNFASIDMITNCFNIKKMKEFVESQANVDDEDVDCTSSKATIALNLTDGKGIKSYFATQRPGFTHAHLYIAKAISQMKEDKDVESKQRRKNPNSKATLFGIDLKEVSGLYLGLYSLIVFALLGLIFWILYSKVVNKKRQLSPKDERRLKKRSSEKEKSNDKKKK